MRIQPIFISLGKTLADSNNFNNIIKNYPASVTHETLETRDYLFFKINFMFPFFKPIFVISV